MLALIEMKLKENREVSWSGVNVIFASVQKMERTVVKYEYVSSRILWIKLKFSMVKVCVVVWYSPNERVCEEREVLEQHGQDSRLGWEWI